MTYRALRITGLKEDLIISKATALKLKHSAKRTLQWDELPDGTWRIIYSDRFGDLPKLQAIVMEEVTQRVSKKAEPVSVRLEGWDIELSMSSIVRINKPGMIHFDEMKDGSWKMIFGSDVPDLRGGFEMKMIRED